MFQDKGLALTTPRAGTAQAGRLSAVNVTRRVVQGVGGGVCVAMGAAMPWAGFEDQGVWVGPLRLPGPLLLALAASVVLGLCFFAGSVWGLITRLPTHTRLGVVAIACVTCASAAGLEYGYLRTGGLSLYEYRGPARLILYFTGIMLLACAVPEEIGPSLAVRLRRTRLGWRPVLALALLAVSAGAMLGGLVLEGMPHIIDATAYLLQGRMLWSGELATTPPAYPQLFSQELLAFRVSDAGYYGKYPPGWPAVLGAFDAAGLPWLAAPCLAGLLVVLTYLIVAERGSRRLAGLSASLVACCPWLWMNAATMMSHLAAAVWLWAFLWLMLRAMRRRSRGLALLSGLALGMAVLTRPADAAFFALPCVAASIGWLIRLPGVWASRLPLIAAGALPGVGLYLWVNALVTDGSAGSAYGNGHGAVLLQQLPSSPGHALLWLHEGWVGLSSQWFAGALPAGLAILCGAVFGEKYLRRNPLPLACAASLFVCYAVFVFGGRAWVGPRWYVPLIPACAMLIAAGIEAAAFTARTRSPGGILAAGYLRASAVAAGVILLAVLPARIAELVDQPPHGIDGRVVQRVEKAGLTHAVVALPASGLDPGTGEPNYKRGIAGMWAMHLPFERSDVIYVSAIEGWQAMAHDAWPGRALYAMTDQAGDWRLLPVPPEITSQHRAAR